MTHAENDAFIEKLTADPKGMTARQQLGLLRRCRHALGEQYCAWTSLGAGAFGKVVQASDMAQHGKLVAIKVVGIRPEYRWYHEMCLAKEALVAQAVRLSLPGQTGVQHAFASHVPNVYCLVMDVMDKNASLWLKQSPSASMLDRKVLLYGIAQQLSVVHALNCVHRDLKLSNVLMSNDDNSVLLGDFGSSSLEGGNGGGTTGNVGTFAYAAPELMVFKRGCKAGDMWSMGMLAFRLMTGHHFCNADTVPCVLKLIVQRLGSPPDSVKHGMEQRIRTCRSRNKAKLLDALDAQEDTTRLEQLLASAGAEQVDVDFISSLLKWDPAERMTITDALGHDFFADVRDLAEPTPVVHEAVRDALRNALEYMKGEQNGTFVRKLYRAQELLAEGAAHAAAYAAPEE